jgi:hypothetical protein
MNDKVIESLVGPVEGHPSVELKLRKRIEELEAKLEAAEKLHTLATTVSSYAAKDEDESKSILGYVIYAPPWLMHDFDKAIAAFEGET